MEATEPGPDVEVLSASRARRAIGLIAVSLMVIAATAAMYLRPASVPGATAIVTGSSYRVSAIDFVNPATGWIAVHFDSGGYAILHTTDGGHSWTRQLAHVSANYLKFFDSAAGVLGTIGSSPQLLRTKDGGRTWSALPPPPVAGIVLSWSFVDSSFGWMLVGSAYAVPSQPTYLYRTDDGGVSWRSLGVPVPAPDRAFQVSFSYFTTGWLTSANSGPYAYRTTDSGATWTRVPLPAPRGGWPKAGSFMVAVQPTLGLGAAASVVYFPAMRGRTGVGAAIRDFPPLTVSAYDGGRLGTYAYATAVGSRDLGPGPQAQAPNQSELSTIDDGASWSPMAAPSKGGAVGYLDARDWWWIGSGQWAKSGDGGATWTNPLTVRVIEPLSGSLIVLDRGHAWYAAAAGPHQLLVATDDGGFRWRMVLLPPVSDLSTP